MNDLGPYTTTNTKNTFCIQSQRTVKSTWVNICDHESRQKAETTLAEIVDTNSAQHAFRIIHSTVQEINTVVPLKYIYTDT